jgi:uncharacterized protein (TIGR00288 family)
MSDERQTLAVFIDFENLALGFKEREDRFDISRVLARLVEKGNIVVKRAYADWYRFSAYTPALHEAAIELIEIPRRGMTGKNSADMRLCVDVMDLCYSKTHITTFVILSGDSDFSPLVSKLKENGKQVIGMGMKDSTSELLRDNCHEFIYYEDLKADEEENAAELTGADEKEKQAFSLLLESLQALRRENRDTLWSSMIKETMKRKRPSFNETSYGFKSFSRLLEAAARRGLVELTRDAAKRSYIVTRFGADLKRPETEQRRDERQSAAPRKQVKQVRRKSVTSSTPTPAPATAPRTTSTTTSRAPAAPTTRVAPAATSAPRATPAATPAPRAAPATTPAPSSTPRTESRPASTVRRPSSTAVPRDRERGDRERGRE